MATLSTGQRHKLLDLPNEVLRIVIVHLHSDDHWNNTRELSALRLTCKRISQLAEPAWWSYLCPMKHANTREQTHSILQANERAFGLVRTLDVLLSAGSESFSPESYSLVSQFQNVRTIIFEILPEPDWSPDLPPWRDALQTALDTHHCRDLQKCSLSGAYLADNRLVSLNIEHLLQSPKLKHLELCHLDLTTFQGDPIPAHSTCRKTLKLNACAVDEGSVMAFLSKPVALEKMSIERVIPNVNLDELDPNAIPARELSLVQAIIAALSRTQRSLMALKICYGYGEMLEQEEYRGECIDGHLKGLKRLSIEADLPTREHLNALAQEAQITDYTWKPVNVFDHLPPNIERLKIETCSQNCGIDLKGLADDILDIRHNPIPSSLQRLDVVMGYLNHMRPFPEPNQEKDNQAFKSIHRLISERLPISQLIYSSVTIFLRIRTARSKETALNACLCIGG